MSHVQSLLFDSWSEAQVSHMSLHGNLRFNAHHEALLEMNERIQADAEAEARRAFVHAKYVERRWYSDTPRTCTMHPPEESSEHSNSSDGAVAAAATAAASSPVESVAPTASAQSSRRADQRRERINRAAPLNALEVMEREMQRARPLAPEAIFSPAAARAALARLAASAGAAAAPLPPLHPLLSFVLTTSAVPSNPSLELIERVLQSCELYLGLDQHRPVECDSDVQCESLASGAPAAAAATAPAAPASSSVTVVAAPSPLKCLLLLVMDGYAFDPKLVAGCKPKYKNGLLDDRSIAAYEEYKMGLRGLISRQPFPHLHLVALELPFRQGFAGAVHQSLQFVSSEYMMVLQHDWAFIRQLPHSIWQIIRCMERNQTEQPTADPTATTTVDAENTSQSPSASTAVDSSPSPSPSSSSLSPSPSPSLSPSPSPSPPSGPVVHLPINYVTFQSSTTLHYLAKDYHDVRRHVGSAVHRLHHYPLDDSPAAAAAAAEAAASTPAVPPISSVLPATTSSSPLPLAPVYFWFDRNHVVRTRYYRDHVFGQYRFMKSAAFIEDSFGQIMLNVLRGSYHGTKRHKRREFQHYASYIYYPDNGGVMHVDHIHGRKWMTDAQREEKHGARDDEARDKIKRREAARLRGMAASEAGAAGKRMEDSEEEGGVDYAIWGE